VGGAGYFKGTSFDLAIQRPGSPWVYHQLRVPRTTSGNASTVLFTNLLTVDLAPNSSIAIPCEIYGDCDACAWPEGRPPKSSVTTWRIFGEIFCTSDASGTVAHCEIRNVGSAQPTKQLGSVNPHNPSHFPPRVLPRPPVAVIAPFGGCTTKSCCCTSWANNCTFAARHFACRANRCEYHVGRRRVSCGYPSFQVVRK
jgi:hypothetical protein